MGASDALQASGQCEWRSVEGFGGAETALRTPLCASPFLLDGLLHEPCGSVCVEGADTRVCDRGALTADGGVVLLLKPRLCRGQRGGGGLNVGGVKM